MNEAQCVVVDTNVWAVAEGMHSDATEQCVAACVAILQRIDSGVVRKLVVDTDDRILAEYISTLKAAGTAGLAVKLARRLWNTRYGVASCKRVDITEHDDPPGSFLGRCRRACGTSTQTTRSSLPSPWPRDQPRQYSKRWTRMVGPASRTRSRRVRHSIRVRERPALVTQRRPRHRDQSRRIATSLHASSAGGLPVHAFVASACATLRQRVENVLPPTSRAARFARRRAGCGRPQAAVLAGARQGASPRPPGSARQLASIVPAATAGTSESSVAK